MSNYIKLINNFDALKLMTFRANIDAFIDEVNSDKTNLVDALYTLTEKEMAFRQDRVNRAMIVTSHFPFVKTFEDYDFNYQPRLNKDEILAQGNETALSETLRGSECTFMWIYREPHTREVSWCFESDFYLQTWLDLLQDEGKLVCHKSLYYFPIFGDSSYKWFPSIF